MTFHTAELGEVAVIGAGGGAPQDPNEFSSEGVPFVRAGSLKLLLGGATEDSLEHLTEAVAAKHGLRKYPANTILFAKSGMSAAKGLVYRLRKESYIVNHLAALIPKECIDAGYLEHSLRVFSPTRLIQDAAYPSIRLSDLGKMAIPLHPLPHQRRIAAILDQAEALRTKRREALAQLDGLAQAVFLEMFGDPVTNQKGWDCEEFLGAVSDIVSGVTKGRKLGSKDTRRIPYLAVVNVQDRRIDLSTIKYIDATSDEIRKYKLLKNDLILTEGGDPDKLGRGTLWNNELPECIHQNHIFRVRLNSKKINPVFLNWLIGSQRGKQYFLKSAKQTTGIASINMTQLRNFPLLVPPISIQDDFARRVAMIDKLKLNCFGSLSKIEELFCSLQHRAFRGEL